MDTLEDNTFERQVIRAAHKLAYEGRYVGNPMLASCAEIMLKDFNPSAIIPGCSSGAPRDATSSSASTSYSVGILSETYQIVASYV